MFYKVVKILEKYVVLGLFEDDVDMIVNIVNVYYQVKNYDDVVSLYGKVVVKSLDFEYYRK